MFQLNSVYVVSSFIVQRVSNTVAVGILDGGSRRPLSDVFIQTLPQNLMLLGLVFLVALLILGILFAPLVMMFRDPVPWKIFAAAAPWWIAFAPIGLGLTIFGCWKYAAIKKI